MWGGVGRVDTGGSEQEALGASDDVFSSSQGIWQKLEGQREGEGGGPQLSCQGRPTNQQLQGRPTEQTGPTGYSPSYQ